MKKDVYELTNPQKSIWLTEEFYKGTAINNICGNLIIREKVNFEKFKKAINLFVKTNESFRLKFFIEDSTPKQYVSDYSEFNLPCMLFPDFYHRRGAGRLAHRYQGSFR